MTLSALDYELIRQQLAGAAMDIDAGRADSYADRFTDQGSFETIGFATNGESDGLNSGRNGLMSLVTSLYDANLGNCRHWNSLPVIVETEDGAVVSSYFQVLRTGRVPQAGVMLTGIYNDTFVRADSAWKIHTRVCLIDPQPGTAAPSTDVLVVGRDAFILGLIR